MNNGIVLTAKNIVKKYKTGKTEFEVLKDVSLSVKKGEILTIVGPSGAGKTTLLYILGLLEKPEKGEVILDGNKVSLLKESEKAKIRAKKIGFVFQSFYLLPELNCLQNVALPAFVLNPSNFWKRAAIYDKAKKLLENVGMLERINHKPSQLSGGEMQRVAICRSLINDPDIILADEPTGNLDSKNSEIVVSILFSICKENKKALILVSHNETLAQRADKIVKLVDGKITE